MNHVHKFIRGLSATGVLLIFFGLATVMTSCDDDDDNSNSNKPYAISGSANGAQQVPATTSSGSATISGNYNPTTRELDYSSAWTDLSGPPVSGGFYAGASGVVGASVGAAWTIVSGAGTSGSTSGKITLTEEQEKTLLSGGWYYSYSTASNPQGEVRGQISASR